MTTASQPMDKRMLRTREAIRCALLSLLNQKDASQINVSELTEKAQISRKTFYLHYASVDEALQELENEIEGWVMAQLAQSDIWDNRHDLYTILSRVDKALQEHETYSCYLENRRSRYFLMYRLKNSIAKLSVCLMTRSKKMPVPRWERRMWRPRRISRFPAFFRCTTIG